MVIAEWDAINAVYKHSQFKSSIGSHLAKIPIWCHGLKEEIVHSRVPLLMDAKTPLCCLTWKSQVKSFKAQSGILQNYIEVFLNKVFMDSKIHMIMTLLPKAFAIITFL